MNFFLRNCPIVRKVLRKKKIRYAFPCILSYISKHYTICVIFLSNSHASGNCIRIQPIIPVYKEHILARSSIQTGFSRKRSAFISFVKHTNTGILSGQRVKKDRASIRASVIHQDNLQIGICLIQKALRALIQIPLRPVHRNND